MYVARYPTFRPGLMRVAAVAATSDLNLRAHGTPLMVHVHDTRNGLALAAPLCLSATAATWNLKGQAQAASWLPLNT